jgi:L-seryl-tRNA(Ser) seleniumtransferase
MGTGCLVDTAQFGLPRQPTLADAVRQGADVVIASGDKLLGGPQAGLILGRANLIARLARHPLARAIRVDKLTLAVLSQVLQVYRFGNPLETLPTLRYLARTEKEVRKLAERLRGLVRDRSVLEPSVSEVGGGSLPGHGLPTWRVGLNGDAETLLAMLRRRGVIARIERGRVWLDPRTAERDEVERVRRMLPEVLP